MAGSAEADNGNGESSQHFVPESLTKMQELLDSKRNERTKSMPKH